MDQNSGRPPRASAKEGEVARRSDDHGARANPFRLTAQEIADLRRKKAEFIAYGLTVFSPGWATRALAEAAAKDGEGAPMPPRASWSAAASGTRRRGDNDR